MCAPVPPVFWSRHDLAPLKHLSHDLIAVLDNRIRHRTALAPPAPLEGGEDHRSHCGRPTAGLCHFAAGVKDDTEQYPINKQYGKKDRADDDKGGGVDVQRFSCNFMPGGRVLRSGVPRPHVSKAIPVSGGLDTADEHRLLDRRIAFVTLFLHKLLFGKRRKQFHISIYQCFPFALPQFCTCFSRQHEAEILSYSSP